MPNSTEPKERGTAPLDETHRLKVADLVNAIGEVSAAARLGLSRHATARAMAGMPLHAGSRLIIRSYFASGAAPSERAVATEQPRDTASSGLSPRYLLPCAATISAPSSV